MTFRTHVFRAFLIALLAATVTAQVPYAARRATLASSFDLDGEAADDNQVVAAAAIADSTTYTLAADPDICRLVDVTVTDADSSISAGTLTIQGTDCWDRPLAATFALNGGSGVRTGTAATYTSGGTSYTALASGAYFKTVTSVISGVVTGEGAGDELIVGYTTNSPKGWPLYGRQSYRPDGSRFVDIFGAYEVNVLIKNGAATTDVIAVAPTTTAPFTNVSVGDFLVFNITGQQIVRKVATRTDADTITVSPGVTIPAAGVNFSYRKLFFSTDPDDGWISVVGYNTFSVIVEVDANANTGGVVSSIECAVALSDEKPNGDVVAEVDTDTVATGSTGFAATSVILGELPHYTHCRVGIKFGTGDDTDTANEDIDIAVALSK